ncbi:protein mom, partial [Escherichia coli]|nr:protein mom [Escherichia coli]
EYLRANKERAVAHKFNQYRYIRFLNKRAKKRLNTKLFRIQPYPKRSHLMNKKAAVNAAVLS